MTESFIEKLEAYLAGEISKADLQAIAREEGISNLEAEIKWLQDSQVAIEAAGLRKQLREVLPKPEKKPAKIIQLRSVRTALAIAASILVLVVAYLGWNNSQSNSLYATYEFIDPGPPVLMSQSDDYTLYDALTFYSEGDYSEAVKRFQQIEADYPNNDTLTFYLGASLLYQGNTEAARASLEKISQRAGFQQKADWLLVLTALKEKDLERAERLARTISNTPQHEFFTQAQSLIQDLNNANK